MGCAIVGVSGECDEVDSISRYNQQHPTLFIHNYQLINCINHAYQPYQPFMVCINNFPFMLFHHSIFNNSYIFRYQ